MDTHDTIYNCIQMRRRAKELEDEASALKEQANEELKQLRDSGLIDGDRVEMEGVGKIAFVTQKRANLNAKKFKEGLFLSGVSIDVIARAETDATTVSESFSVRFTPWGD